jgi:hypothetical protein
MIPANSNVFKTYMKFPDSTITVSVPLNIAMDDARDMIEPAIKDHGFEVEREADERSDPEDFQ